MSLISDYHSAQSRSRAMSFHQSSVYAGSIVGAWNGAWFAETRGWRMGFYVFGGAGVILSIFLYRFLREPQRGKADAEEQAEGVERVGFSEALSLIFRTPTAFLVMGAFMAANFVATIFLMWTPTFLVDKFQFRLTTAGLSGSIFINLASACAVPVSGWLSDRLAQRRPGGRMIPQAAGLFCGAIFILMVGLTREVNTLLAVMALFGICKGFYDANIFAGLYDVIPPRARGTAAGIMNTVGWGGGALGPLAFGSFAKRGSGTTVENMSEAIAFCSGFYLVGGFLLTLAILFYAKRDVRRVWTE
jgi:MFS family permease